MNEKLYFYECLEASKYFRFGYTWNTSRQKVLNDIKSNFIEPVRIKIRIVTVESEEFYEQEQKHIGGNTK